MFNFFVSYDAETEGYVLSQAGYISIVILLVAILVASAFLFNRKQNAKVSTKQLVFSAVSIAIAFALSYVKIFQMPWGGSITLCSMLFVCLVGYFYGPKLGLMAALAYGLLQLVQDGGTYMIHPFQVCCDYIFSFMALGLSGFFANKKNGLLLGYLTGILGRFVFLSLGGYIFWMSYMPESFPTTLAFLYPIAYNGSYIFAEGLITIIILLVPAVNKGILHIKQAAISE
jgi:thiamine transporter